MFNDLNDSWRLTFADLKEQFRNAAEEFRTVAYVVLESLDTPGAIPRRFQKKCHRCGEHEVGEIRRKFEAYGLPESLPPQHRSHSSTVSEHFDWDGHAMLGYLYGPKKGRDRFASLANQAWLALPGTDDGKANAFPQKIATERWWKFLYEKLRRSAGTYFKFDRVLLVEYRGASGEHCEEFFRAEKVAKGDVEALTYPSMHGNPAGSQRWLVTELATDPFTASIAAIDAFLSESTPGLIVSPEEMQDFMHSIEYQQGNMLIDYIGLSHGEAFPINRHDCDVVPGDNPTICPSSSLPSDPAERRILFQLLPGIADRFRELRFVGDGQTIHWVGPRKTLGSICRCTTADRRALEFGPDFDPSRIEDPIQLTDKELAEFVGVSPRTIFTWRTDRRIRTGMLPTGKWVYSKSEIEVLRRARTNSD